MSRRIPITIDKIKVDKPYNSFNPKPETQYLIGINERNQNFQQTFIADRKALEKLRDEINALLNSSNTAEVLGVTEEEGSKIEAFHAKEELCKTCNYKLSANCKTCVFVLQSPLERKLFIELKNNFISFEPQKPLSWKGLPLYNQDRNDFSKILTIPDFYIESGKTKLCVYTDGHTYHERTEEQALRDRNIDRQLQSLGFTVLRYTGKEVKDDTHKIVQEIKKWLKVN